MDRFCSGEISHLAIPETAIGGMGCHSLPHLPGQAVLYPQQVVSTVHVIVHVHGDGRVLVVVGVSSIPLARANGADMELDQVENGGGHR